MLEHFSKFCVEFCNCTPISCPVKLRPNGWKVHLMAHLDCKYLYSSLLLEIAFRNFKWIPLPHELDWYHYSVQFFRVLLFLPSGGSYLFYWLQGSQRDSKKICWCAQRWTLDSTSSGDVIVETHMPYIIKVKLVCCYDAAVLFQAMCKHVTLKTCNLFET